MEGVRNSYPRRIRRRYVGVKSLFFVFDAVKFTGVKYCRVRLKCEFYNVRNDVVGRTIPIAPLVIMPHAMRPIAL